MTSNGEMLMNKTITPNPPPTIFTNNQTDSATENATDARPIIINENNVDWIGIVGVFGSAIAGAFFGSYLQNLFSNRNIRKKEHLTDLKNNVSKPLYEEVTSPDFSIKSVEFQTFDEDKGRKITSDDILFHDFMENHYPDIHTSLKEFYESKLDLDNTEHDLRNKLISTFGPALETMKAKYTDNQYFLRRMIDTLVNAIIDGRYDKSVSAIVNKRYDKSYFHITESGHHRILYFYHVKDDMIPFKSSSTERLQYVIFESRNMNQKVLARR